MEIIKAENITKVFSDPSHAHLPILNGVTMSVQAGEFASIIGKSGSGKTTLMNILGCLDQPTSGSYWFDGEDISQADPDHLAHIRNQKIGFIFQTFNLLEDATAIDNVALPQLYAGVPEKAARQKAAEYLNMVELGNRLTYYPNQLSSSQMSRREISTQKRVSKFSKFLND